MSKDKYYEKGICEKCGKEYDKYYCEWDDFSFSPDKIIQKCECGHLETEENNAVLRYRKRI